MPIIDPQGLFDGDRLSACSDRAKLLWPFLYCASNGYARLEVNLNQIRRRCFSGFAEPPSDSEIVSVLQEYALNFLVLLYAHSGKQWLQFDTAVKYLPRHKSKKDTESPAPSEDAWQDFNEGYVEWKNAKSLNLQLVRKLSENFGKIRDSCHGIGIGIGVGDGIGVGVGDEKTAHTFLETDGQGEDEVKAEKQIPQSCQTILGVRAETYTDVLNQIKALALRTSNGQVVREFEEWAVENQGDEFRGKPLTAWLRSLDNPYKAEQKKAASDPEVTQLTYELAYLSDNNVTFDNKAKVGLREELDNGATVDEIVSVFRTDFYPQIKDDEFNLKRGGSLFVQKVGQLVYTYRRKSQERLQEDAAVERKAQSLTEEAEVARRAREVARNKAEEEASEGLPD